MSDSEQDGGVPLLESLHSATPTPSPPPLSAKRKRPAEEKQGSSKSDKRRRQRERKRVLKDLSETSLDIERGVNTAYAAMTPALLADALSRATKRFAGDDASAVELADLQVPERAILDASEWDATRDADGLPGFLEGFVEGGEAALKKAGKGNGAPHTIVVTSAGLRAANLTRSLRKFQTKDVIVSKLFAKHTKLEEAVKYCKRTNTGIGVGTPQRISDLLDDGNYERLTALNKD